jgi:hypothetical protein
MFATFFKYKGFRVEKTMGCARNEYRYRVIRTNKVFGTLEETKRHINNELAAI